MSDVKASFNTGELRALIFDYGEVLCHPPRPEALDRMAHVFSIDASHFRMLYERYRGPYDRGDITAEEYWSAIAKDSGAQNSTLPIDQLREWDVEIWSHLNPVMIAWLEQIHSLGTATALLSNMHCDMVSYSRKNFDWLRYFNCLVFSSELHLVKPEPGIFEYCLSCLRVAPEQALFFDDREPNIQAARAIGIHGIRVRSVEQLAQDLESAGFLPLPPAAIVNGYSERSEQAQIK
jgi:putative hydrolase of the HAD superfamily